MYIMGQHRISGDGKVMFYPYGLSSFVLYSVNVLESLNVFYASKSVCTLCSFVLLIIHKILEPNMNYALRVDSNVSDIFYLAQ
jgi:hypothetical protein